MLERFFPNEYLDSIQDIDWDMYYKQGIRGIISDIDNTLVPHGAPATPEIIAYFKELHQKGIDTCLISNNKESRVEPFAYAVESKYIFNAHKPSTKNYEKAMELMGTTKETTLFLGDQIFTDIWGANRCGIQTVMVKQIDKKEEIQIVLKRIPEKFVLWRWRKRLLKKNKE
ncbi:MAG: YqeG family HAD IIIA-type phosphatase [Eubacterium sp.]|nr:YqeG family HAD IIIA-type phosphatase [Eubacterium sp.]